MKSLFDAFNVHVSDFIQPIPALQIDPLFQHCSDRCRADMNKWLLDMFGVRHQAIFIGHNNLFVSPEMCAVLRGFHENP